MKRILIAVSALTLAVSAAYAQTTPPGAKRDAQSPSGSQPSGMPSSGTSSRDTQPSLQSLDKDRDGTISKKEAEASATVTRDFSRLDKNGDGKLDASELAAHSSGSDSGSRSSTDTAPSSPRSSDTAPSSPRSSDTAPSSPSSSK